MSNHTRAGLVFLSATIWGTVLVTVNASPTIGPQIGPWLACIAAVAVTLCAMAPWGRR